MRSCGVSGEKKFQPEREINVYEFVTPAKRERRRFDSSPPHQLLHVPCCRTGERLPHKEPRLVSIALNSEDGTVSPCHMHHAMKPAQQSVHSTPLMSRTSNAQKRYRSSLNAQYGLSRSSPRPPWGLRKGCISYPLCTSTTWRLWCGSGWCGRSRHRARVS